MSNLPSPYDGDYPDDNIDLNLLNLDNAIDVYSIPDNVRLLGYFGICR